MHATTPSVADLKTMFTQVNTDTVAEGGDAVPLSPENVEYYAYQIEVIFEVAEDAAQALALALCNA